MKIDSLSNIELEYINESLSTNNGMSNVEYSNLKKKHPYAIMRDDNIHLIGALIKHYGLHDTEFNSFILNKFGKPDYDIDFFYQLTYGIGQYTVPHYDKKTTVQTTLILLTDDFTGGELIINNKDVNLNKTGMYINFNGNELKHSVNKVLSGQRSVLAIMFSKKQNLL